MHHSYIPSTHCVNIYVFLTLLALIFMPYEANCRLRAGQWADNFVP